MARILLIEDDESVRPMLRLVLTHFGHTVMEAVDGKEGLALVASSDFDLVITDLVMPEVEGLDVLMQLRKRTPPIKAIAISGGGRVHPKGYLQLAKRLGASKVLRKPFSNDALLAAVQEVLLLDPPQKL
jgi:CheY-like chemotaxis protein